MTIGYGIAVAGAAIAVALMFWAVAWRLTRNEKNAIEAHRLGMEVRRVR